MVVRHPNAEQSTLEVRNEGVIKYVNIKSVVNKNGETVVMNRHGELVVVDETGREKEKYPVIYGAVLRVKDGQTVKAKQMVAEWDPYTVPILTEVGGIIQYGDLVDGQSLQEVIDEVTGRSRKVVTESKNKLHRPSLTLMGADGKPVTLSNGVDARYLLPMGTNITCLDGARVEAGDVMAKNSA